MPEQTEVQRLSRRVQARGAATPPPEVVRPPWYWVPKPRLTAVVGTLQAIAGLVLALTAEDRAGRVIGVLLALAGCGQLLTVTLTWRLRRQLQRPAGPGTSSATRT